MDYMERKDAIRHTRETYYEITIKQACALIGVTESFWSDCESGRQYMDDSLWRKFCLEANRVYKPGKSTRKYHFYDLEIGQYWDYQGQPIEISRAVMAARSYQTRAKVKFQIDHDQTKNSVRFTRISGSATRKSKYKFHDLEIGDSWSFSGTASDIAKAIRSARNFQSQSRVKFMIERPSDNEIKITRVSRPESNNGTAGKNRKYAFHDLNIGESWTFYGDTQQIVRAINAAKCYQTQNRIKFLIDRKDEKSVCFTRVKEKKRYSKYSFHGIDIGWQWQMRGDHQQRSRALTAMRCYQTRSGYRYRVDDQGHETGILRITRVE